MFFVTLCVDLSLGSTGHDNSITSLFLWLLNNGRQEDRIEEIWFVDYNKYVKSRGSTIYKKLRMKMKLEDEDGEKEPEVHDNESPG